MLENYKHKQLTPDEAIALIKDDSRLFISHGASDPQTLVPALIRNAERFSNLTITQMLIFGQALYCRPEMQKHFKYISLFASVATRKPIWENRAEFMPVHFSRIPDLLRSDEFKVDCAMLHLSMPDKDGFCSFGINCDCTKAAAEAADVIVAELNEQVPYTFGDQNKIHISKLDGFVPVSYPIITAPRSPIGEVEHKIGMYCASLVDDGATMQLGVGAIPDAVLQNLKSKKNLGIHTEMFSDGVMDLMKAGVITGSEKVIDKGKVVSNFLVGTQELYDFVNLNEDIHIYPADYTNNPYIIGKNNNVVSINSCLELDYCGQISAESIGRKQFSGIGGQGDFIRGAYLSKGGKSILALPSTARDDEVSRIVPRLTDNAFVTTTMHDVDYVVTEYGIAKLSKRTLKQRALALIEIAHPKFRDWLMENVKADFF